LIVYLVRHARAGHRRRWNGDDRVRPLDERGRRQAELLVGQLEGRDVGRIASSPYVRCVDTVVPLAQARSLELETTDALAEGATAVDALELFASAAAPLVVSVHGDLVEDLLGEPAKKGETIVLDVEDGEVRVLERWPPQA
jgi:8-oxo-dGTP diphosphatase